MKLFKMMVVLFFLNFLVACTNDKSNVVLPSQPAMATGGQDAALFAAKTY